MQLIRVDAVDVRIDGNAGESIVLLHGWPDTHHLWDAQVTLLEARYRCVRFTLPGFAPGDARGVHTLDETIALIRRVIERACDNGPVTLLLHDWGCFFGYQFALRHPAMVRRIIGVDIGDAGSRRHLRETSWAAKLAIVGYQSWLAAAWRIGGGLGDRMAQSMARAARAPVARLQANAEPRHAVRAQMGYPYWLQWTGRYRQAKAFTPACPMFFIYGRRKPFMFHSSAWAEDLAARPGSRVLACDSGHWVMVDQAAQFNAAIIDWLAQGDAATGNEARTGTPLSAGR